MKHLKYIFFVCVCAMAGITGVRVLQARVNDDTSTPVTAGDTVSVAFEGHCLADAGGAIGNVERSAMAENALWRTESETTGNVEYRRYQNAGTGRWLSVADGALSLVDNRDNSSTFAHSWSGDYLKNATATSPVKWTNQTTALYIAYNDGWTISATETTLSFEQWKYNESVEVAFDISANEADSKVWKYKDGHYYFPFASWKTGLPDGTTEDTKNQGYTTKATSVARYTWGYEDEVALFNIVSPTKVSTAYYACAATANTSDRIEKSSTTTKLTKDNMAGVSFSFRWGYKADPADPTCSRMPSADEAYQKRNIYWGDYIPVTNSDLKNSGLAADVYNQYQEMGTRDLMQYIYSADAPFSFQVKPVGRSPYLILESSPGTGPKYWGWSHYMDTLTVTAAGDGFAPVQKTIPIGRQEWNVWTETVGTAYTTFHGNAALSHKTVEAASLEGLHSVDGNMCYADDKTTSLSGSIITFDEKGGTVKIAVDSLVRYNGLAFFTASHGGNHILRYVPNEATKSKEINQTVVKYSFATSTTPCSWVKVSGKADTVTIEVEPFTELHRSTDLTITLQYLWFTGSSRYSSITNTLTLTQRNEATAQYAEFKHNRGKGYTTFDERGYQRVHTIDTTIYYEKNSDITLTLRERGFNGYMRWYDYNTGRDPQYYTYTENGTTKVRTLSGFWKQMPYGRLNHNLNGEKITEPFLSINDDEEHSQGLYFLPNNQWGWGNPRSYNGVNTNTNNSQFPSPIVHINENLDLDIACDVSNYSDYVVEKSGETLISLTEPTLSYRQIFHLRPVTNDPVEDGSDSDENNTAIKKAVAEALAQCNRKTGKYYEMHETTVPPGTAVDLRTHYELVRTEGANNPLRHYWVDVDGNGTYLRTSAKNNYWPWWMRRNGKVFSELVYNVVDEFSANKDHFGNYFDKNDYFKVVCNKDTTMEWAVWIIPATSAISGTFNGKYTGDTLWLAHFTVHWSKDASALTRDTLRYGPSAKPLITKDEIARNYILLAEQNFDFNKPATEGYTLYPYPLPVDESTYGFVYPKAVIGDGNIERTNEREPESFAYYGEYAIVNKVGTDACNGAAGSAGWLLPTIQHTGSAADGYCLYVDGAKEPGKVVSLTTDAQLCSGQQMYCAMWLCNPAKTDKNVFNPDFNVAIEGRNQDENGNWQDWKQIETYYAGELDNGNATKEGLWRQICFPLVSAQNYQESRVTLYNYSATNVGNDFLVDDVWLYASKLPLDAFQTNTQCLSDENGEDHTATIIRVDYIRFVGDYTNNNLYYQIYDNTVDTAMKLNYFNLTGDTCGYVPLPTSNDFVPAVDEQYKSLSDFIAKTNAVNSTQGQTHIGYVQITENDEKRWVMYIAEVLSSSTFNVTHKYEVRTAYALTDLPITLCSMRTELPVYERTSFMFNGETYPAQGQCANERYPLEITVKGDLIDGDRNVTLESAARGDWLVGYDFDDIYYYAYKAGLKAPADAAQQAAADEAFKKKYGYPRSMVKDAIEDMRRTPSVQMKSNYDVTDYRNLKAGADYWDNTDHYKVIVDLCQRGLLRLALEKDYFYMRSEDTVRYWVYPTAGTAQVMYKDTLRTLNECATPTYLMVFSNKSDYGLNLGVSEDATANGSVPRMRVTQSEANTRFGVPIDSIGNKVILGWDSTQIDANGTTDPLVLQRIGNPDFSMRYTQDRIYTDNKDKYYHNGDTVWLAPIGQAHVDSMRALSAANPSYGEGHPGFWRVNTATMRAGYEYTLRVQMRARSENMELEDAQNTGCMIGYAYITMLVVPDTVIWHPTVADIDGYYHWGEDQNWLGFIDGKVSNVGYVPLVSSVVIIPSNLEPEKYPYIIKENGRYSADVHYNSAVCKKLQFRSGACALGQEYLTYEAAYVDMPMQSTYWNTVSAPLQDMYSGDFFIPHTGTYINGKSLEPAKAADDYTQDFTVQPFSGLRTTDAAYAFWASYYNQNIAKVTATSNETIESETLAFEQSNGMSEKLLPGRGLSVAGWGPGDGVEDMEIRLPKPDVEFTYYNDAGQPTRTESVSRTNSGRLAFTPDENGTMSVTLTNKQAGSSFLFGNPTMAYIDVFKLQETNSDVLQQGTFRYQKNGAWITVASTTANSSDRFIAPMQSVMLTTKEAASNVTIKITGECLALTTAQTSTISAAPRRANGHTLSRRIMNIVAYTDYNRAFATLAAFDFANNGYNADEDVIFMSSGVEAANSGNVSVSPLNIYTLAGTQPLAIDIREQIGIVPLGFVIGDDYRTDSLTLYFGLNKVWDQECYLCDSKTGMCRRICNDSRIRIATPANHEMRYYIEGPYKTPDNPTTPIDDAPAMTDTDGQHVRAFSVGCGMVSVVASGNISEVRLYDVAGRLLQETVPANQTPVLTMHSPSGLVIADVRLTNGLTYRTKVMVQ